MLGITYSDDSNSESACQLHILHVWNIEMKYVCETAITYPYEL